MTRREMADNYRSASKAFAAITAVCLIEAIQAQSTWAGLCWLGGTAFFAAGLRAASIYVVNQRNLDEAVAQLARMAKKIAGMDGKVGELGERLKEFVNIAQTFAND